MAIYIGSSKKTIRIGSSITRTLLIPELVSIVVTAPPTQTEYNPFTSFNPAGMVVTAEYDNGEKKTITDYTITNGDYLTADMTSVTISYTARGITKTTTQDIRVNHIKLDIPYSNDTFVYTGSEMTPIWTGYDSSLMTIGGDTSGTNAGTYSTNFALKDKINYTWADGTTADNSVTWTIGKAQAIITLDKTSVVLNGDKLEETVTFSSVGMTSVMVMSSDMSVATVSMEDNVIIISSVNETTGTANIIISGEVDSNYNAPEYPSIEVNAEFAPPMCRVIWSLTGSANVNIGGVIYDSDSTQTMVDVPIGTRIILPVTLIASGTANVTVDGKNVYTSTTIGPATYIHYVTGNTYIEGSEQTLTTGTELRQIVAYGVSNMPEFRNDTATLTISSIDQNSGASGSCYATVTIGNTSYSSTTGNVTIEVPAGTPVTCRAYGNKSATIQVNGTSVAAGYPPVYTYIATGNTHIFLMTEKRYVWDQGGSTPSTHYYASVTISETYAINFNIVPNGTLTTTSTGAIGSTVTLTPTPDEGYAYGGATVTYTLNGVQQTIELDANTKTFTMPAADVTITPVWVYGGVVTKTLTSIAVTTPPTKTEYSTGEVFDPTGMVVTATYSDGSTAEVTGYTITNGDQLSADMTTVNISYTEGDVTATTTYEVGFVLPMCTVNIYTKYTGINTFFENVYVTIDGQKYSASNSLPEQPTLTVPVGSVLHCYVNAQMNAITVNDNAFASDTDADGVIECDYTISKDTNVFLNTAAINPSLPKPMIGNIGIYEIGDTYYNIETKNEGDIGGGLVSPVVSKARYGESVTVSMSKSDTYAMDYANVTYVKDGEEISIGLSSGSGSWTTSFVMPAADVIIKYSFHWIGI